MIIGWEWIVAKGPIPRVEIGDICSLRLVRIRSLTELCGRNIVGIAYVPDHGDETDLMEIVINLGQRIRSRIGRADHLAGADDAGDL